VVCKKIFEAFSQADGSMARTLKAVGTVAVIPQERVNPEIARMFPPNSVVNSRLVYFAPPLSNPKEKLPVAILIPWYAYSVTTSMTNPKTGAVQSRRSVCRVSALNY
jgi:hypothetical protein